MRLVGLQVFEVSRARIFRGSWPFGQGGHPLLQRSYWAQICRTGAFPGMATPVRISMPCSIVATG